MANVHGNVNIPIKLSVGGDVQNIQNMTASGDIEKIGTVIRHPEWGMIIGDINNQQDLQVSLHERDNSALSVQDIEKILYL